MMRPVENLQTDPDVETAQQNNLRSACAYAGLLTKDGSSEVDFYKNIVAIPHYQTYSKIFRLIDQEDPEKIVKDKLEEFREMYEPIVKQNFKDSFELSNGVFKRDESDSVTKYLLSNLNDNVHQNLFNVVSPLKYDQEKKFHKKIMDKQHMYENIDESLVELNKEELSKKLHRAIDKILLAHRNSKIFLILMSGPFLVALYIVKYALKILILYFLFWKKKKVPAEEAEKTKQEEAKPAASHSHTA